MLERFFIPLVQRGGDTGSCIVEGFAYTQPRVKTDRYNLRAEALERAIPAFMKAPALRSMHSNIAAGIVTSAAFEGHDSQRRLKVSAEVVDANEITKTRKGVYRGFSLGGAPLLLRGNDIEVFELREISLVDRAADPGAVFTMVRAEGDDAPEPEVLPEDAGEAETALIIARVEAAHGLDVVGEVLERALDSTAVPTRENLEPDDMKNTLCRKCGHEVERNADGNCPDCGETLERGVESEARDESGKWTAGSGGAETFAAQHKKMYPKATDADIAAAHKNHMLHTGNDYGALAKHHASEADKHIEAANQKDEPMDGGGFHHERAAAHEAASALYEKAAKGGALAKSHAESAALYAAKAAAMHRAEPTELERYSADQPRDEEGKFSIIRGGNYHHTGKKITENHIHALADDLELSSKARGALVKAHRDGKLKTDEHLYRTVAAADDAMQGNHANSHAGIVKAAADLHGVGGTHEGKAWGGNGKTKVKRGEFDAILDSEVIERIESVEGALSVARVALAEAEDEAVLLRGEVTTAKETIARLESEKQALIDMPLVRNVPANTAAGVERDFPINAMLTTDTAKVREVLQQKKDELMSESKTAGELRRSELSSQLAAIDFQLNRLS